MPVIPGLSEGAQRLVCFACNVQWLTGGEALLVRMVLELAVDNAAYYKWARRSDEEIWSMLRNPLSAISERS